MNEYLCTQLAAEMGLEFGLILKLKKLSVVLAIHKILFTRLRALFIIVVKLCRWTISDPGAIEVLGL